MAAGRRPFAAIVKCTARHVEQQCRCCAECVTLLIPYRGVTQARGKAQFETVIFEADHNRLHMIGIYHLFRVAMCLCLFQGFSRLRAHLQRTSVGLEEPLITFLPGLVLCHGIALVFDCICNLPGGAHFENMHVYVPIPPFASLESGRSGASKVARFPCMFGDVRRRRVMKPVSPLLPLIWSRV
jgi:hypothetical protein